VNGRRGLALSGHGTLYLLHPLTPAAHAWVAEHLPADATWVCGARLLKERQEVVGKVETRRAEPFGSALQCCSVGVPIKQASTIAYLAYLAQKCQAPRQPYAGKVSGSRDRRMMS